MAYKLTVRHGPKVVRESFDDLSGAIAAMNAHAEAIRGEGSLEEVSVLRTLEPKEMVAGRIEISTGSLFRRGRDAGLDVMGDGHYVPYAGGVGRRELPVDGDESFAAIEEELR
ncbi:hypothetical protein BH10ACT11_BH10ACT11_06310 [soil metagenome]